MTTRGVSVHARWLLYAAVVAIQLSALWLGATRVSVPAQVLLMPTLALAALAARPGPLRTWTLIALFFSFLGDALPQVVPEPWTFLAMLGAFLVAHVAWILGLWRVRPPRPWLLIVYLAAAVAVVAWTLPGAGVLAPGVVAYAAALMATAVLASGLGWSGVLGGAMFVLSDSLIAVQSFTTFTFSHHDVAVMATYAAAHGLLVWGVTQSPGHRDGLAYSPRHGWQAAP